MVKPCSYINLEENFFSQIFKLITLAHRLVKVYGGRVEGGEGGVFMIIVISFDQAYNSL